MIFKYKFLYKHMAFIPIQDAIKKAVKDNQQTPVSVDSVIYVAPDSTSNSATNDTIQRTLDQNAATITTTSSLNAGNVLLQNSFNPNAAIVNPTQTQQKPQTTGQQKLAENPEVRKATPVVDKDKKIEKASIKDLEKQTNLTLYPYLFGGELARIKHQFSNMNINKYYLLLCLLVYGFDNKTLSSSSQGHERYVIDEAFINDFYKMAKQPLLQEALKKTPAWQKGCFEEVGKLGATEVNADNMSNNPITGPTKNTPSLVENLLNKIHPDAVENLEKFCNMIRTRSYLSMPKGSFSSIGRLVAAINGVIETFQAIINDIYNGIIFYVQQVYAYVNSIVAEIQQTVLYAINQIIPLDLICLILDTMQCILDDINFFTSLFNMSGPLMNYLNITQNFVNSASTLVSNPFSTVAAYLPPEVNNIIDTVNQIGQDPGGYLSDQLSNFGYAYVATALQGNLVGALVDKFGPQYASVTPLGNILTKASSIYDRYGKGASFFPQTQASLGPNVYNSNREDVYGNPISPGNIGANLKEDFRILGEQTREASLAASEISDGVGKFVGNVKTSVGKIFNGNKPEVQAEED